MISSRFGMWTVLAYAGKRGRDKVWLCKCDCGKEKEVFANSLCSEKSKSCGCIRKGAGTKPHTAARWAESRVPNFWRRVDKGGPEDCWNWTGPTKKSLRKDILPYGTLGFEGKAWIAHRLAYHLTYGGIPDGAMVLHNCDNPKCCNPAHMRLGTHQDNMNDMVVRDRRKRITEEQVQLIREQHGQGCGQTELAKMYDVAQGTISNILNRKGRYATATL